MKIIARIVTTACACALLVRITRLVRAWRTPSIVEYRVVEFRKRESAIGWSSWDGDGFFRPEVHRYVVVAGCPFREEYHGEFISFASSDKHQRVEDEPVWKDAMLALQLRIANGERPDAFVAVERVAL